jgi:hypothetical protein
MEDAGVAEITRITYRKENAVDVAILLEDWLTITGNGSTR